MDNKAMKQEVWTTKTNLKIVKFTNKSQPFLSTVNYQLSVIGFALLLFFVLSAEGQNMRREFPLKIGGTVAIENLYGRVGIAASEETEAPQVVLTVQSPGEVKESDITALNKDGELEIVVKPQNANQRIDLIVTVPTRARVSVETRDGEVAIAGNLEKANVTTETGTISTDVPTEDLRYDFVWTRSRPRFLSDIQLEETKEKSAGRFGISGRFGESLKEKRKRLAEKEKARQPPTANAAEAGAAPPENNENAEADETKTAEKESKSARRKREILTATRVELNFTTVRGIILVNVPPAEVPADLSERRLTEAAKAIVRSGDAVLSEAIRRASPKFFGEYAKNMPPRRREPVLTDRAANENAVAASGVKQVVARVTDASNRAVGGLRKEDFTLTEGGTEREILSIAPVAAPFNLVLLLDVSGSIDNYVNFIRKAARRFVETASPRDKITIIIFNDDAKQISTFTTDKKVLSESLDTFDAGGATAYYDALAYALVDVLRPLRDERTAIIALTDGDDNRSFLPFESLLGSVQESGALIYPLYVPSSLVAASAARNPETTADPLRTRYLGLTSKAEAEGARLAEVSGGVYYPIQRLDDLQKAYDDIAEQLRTAYTITFRSDGASGEHTNAPRLRIRVNRENTIVTTGAVTEISQNKTPENAPQESGAASDTEKDARFQKISFQNNMEIRGEITGIEYRPSLTNPLAEIKTADFDINLAPPSFVLVDDQKRIGVSKWVSPKRTRSYPYERVYNTLSQAKKVTIIPVLKDEGASGERDFIQWDTISLMSLLEVYVVVGYYDDAHKAAKNGKITDQKFDARHVAAKLKEIENYHSSALHWNLKQLAEIGATAEKAKNAYAVISQKTGVQMHGASGIENFAKRISGDVETFMEFSRLKSQQAQNREFVTVQPKESLNSDTKGRVTITDNLGGQYYFTCDETLLENQILYLIEDKHSARGKMPAYSDIKDGLLKMMLYSNLKNVRLGNKNVGYKPVLRLTGGKLKGAVSSESSAENRQAFFALNAFTARQKEFVTKLFGEARTNRFIIKLESVEIAVLEDLQASLRDV